MSLTLLLAIAPVAASDDARRLCRGDCRETYIACRRMALALKHLCRELCEKVNGKDDCRRTCPSSASQHNTRSCLDTRKACEHTCPGSSECLHGCQGGYAVCTGDIARACNTCNDSARSRYKDCRHALHPRRCRAPVLADWGACAAGCGTTLADAFAPCSTARDACIPACASPGGALLP